MQLIQEAGVTGLVIVATFIVALGLRISGKSTSTAPWALGLLALGQIGQSFGMRAVADAVKNLQLDGDKAIIVAQGGAEASANLLIAGVCALILVAVGAAKDKAKE